MKGLSCRISYYFFMVLAAILEEKMQEAETTLIGDMPMLKNETLRNLSVIALDRVFYFGKRDITPDMIRKRYNCSMEEAEEYTKTIDFFSSLIVSREEVYHKIVKRVKEKGLPLLNPDS